jgi:hypothetical protein
VAESVQMTLDGWLSTSRVPRHETHLQIDDPIVTAAWNSLGWVGDAASAYMRFDFCGAWVEFQDYGNTDSPYGWTIRACTRFDWRRFRSIQYWRACHVLNGQDGHLLVCSVTHSGAENVEWDIRAPMVFFPRS